MTAKETQGKEKRPKQRKFPLKACRIHFPVVEWHICEKR